MSQTPTNLQIIPANWAAHATQLAAIRRVVFIDEQQVPEDLEWDGEDEFAQHWLAHVDDQYVGTVRLLRNGHIGRMAVLKPFRNCSIGTALIQAVIAQASLQNLRELYLHAQIHALDFYHRFGFAAEGPVFQDAGIPHRTMRLTLRTQRRLGADHGRFAATNRRAIALDLAQQTQRQLRIFANELEPNVYDHADFAAALSQIVRGYRNADIRLLITDSGNLKHGGHALLAIQRRLSSAIRIRKVDGLADGNNEPTSENYLIADGRGLLCYAVREPEMAWADYNNVPLANEYAARFDELWNHANEDPNLRVLSL